MFDPLLALLSEIPDPRRAEGKLYQLPYVLLFSILAVVTGGNSYRAIRTFIAVNRDRLNAAFGLCWKRAPAHTAIRTILHSLDPKAVEQAFRRHAIGLLDGAIDLSQRLVALDGKTLRRSFDHVRDRKAVQLLHAFEAQAGLILAHVDVDEKSNEISAAQHLLDELPLAHGTITLDALHCQKKTFEAAAQAQAHALVQLKGNQPTLVQQVDIACASQPPASTDISRNTARHRYETRTVEVFGATQAVTDTEWKPLIETIVRVSRKVWHRHAKTGLAERNQRDGLLSGQFYRLGKPGRRRDPQPLARREQAARHTRCDLSGGSIPHSSQPGCVRPDPQLWLQHPTSQSDQHLQSGQICCRSRRT